MTHPGPISKASALITLECELSIRILNFGVECAARVGTCFLEWAFTVSDGKISQTPASICRCFIVLNIFLN